MKNVLIKIRAILKLIILICLATFLILGVIIYLYRPIYKVTLDGEFLGYCSQKSILQARIDEFMEKGSEDSCNVAFVNIDKLPVYNMCLLKRGITTNDDEIFEKVASTGIAYYKYYAVLEDDEEKLYVSDFSTAEAIVQGLKEKNSDNIDKIGILEKYETELKEFTDKETAIASLYKEKKVVVVAKSNSAVYTARKMANGNPSIGISLIKPTTGVITSRFGSIASIRSGPHTGLDIGAATGTQIKACAAGTVTYAGWMGGYGNLIIITHSSSVQTYYGHCSKINVSKGQNVSQGELIGLVGSTGNSTGPHLHLEVRVNGIAYNPQNYVY